MGHFSSEKRALFSLLKKVGAHAPISPPVPRPLGTTFWHRQFKIISLFSPAGNLPSVPSSYVEHAIIQVLQPVIEGVSQLPQGLQNSILIQAVEIMMDTWSSYILKEQIKFRSV